MNAGTNAAVWAASAIEGNITAGEAAGIFTAGSLVGHINAGTDAAVTAVQSISGNITAGAAAGVAAYGHISGELTAGTDLVAFSGASISSTGISAETGTVSVSVFGLLTTSISAGADIFTWSQGATDLTTLTAGDSIFVTSDSMGKIATATAGADVVVSVLADLIAPSLNAGGDVALFAGQTLNTTVNSSANLSTVAGGPTTLFGSTAGDAQITVLDGWISAFLDAGGDAFIDSGGFISTTAVSANYVGLTSLGPLSGTTINAVEGSSVFAGGDVTAVNINVSDGFASLVTAGSAALVNINAATNAEAFVSGLFSASTLNAQQTAFLVADRTLETSISAGTDAGVVLLNDGDFSLTAGADAVIQAVGDVTADASIGGDFSVFGDSAVAGNYQIGGDLISLVATGEVTGQYDVAGNVDTVFVNNRFNATLTAGYLLDDPTQVNPDGGSIGLITAWNDIDGRIEATVAIDSVIAGEDVNATLVAPSIGLVAEDDRSLFDYWSQPFAGYELDWIDSIISDVDHSFALARDAVDYSTTATRNATAADEADLKTETANLQADIAAATEDVGVLSEFQRNLVTTNAQQDYALAARAAGIFANVLEVSVAGISKNVQSSQQLADQALLVVRHDSDARFAQAVNAGQQIATATSATSDIASQVTTQLITVYESIAGSLSNVLASQTADVIEISLDRSDDPCQDYSSGFNCWVGGIVTDAVGADTLANAEDWQIYAGVGIVGAVAIAGVVITVPLAAIVTTALGGGALAALGGAVVAGAAFGAGDYLATWGGIWVVSGFEDHLAPTVSGTVEAGVIGGATGGILHGVGNYILKPVAGKIKSLFGAASNAPKGVGLRVGSGTQTAPAQLVRELKRGEKVADLIAEGKSLTWTTGAEHGILSVVRNGKVSRVVVRGGRDGIDFIEDGGKLFFRNGDELVEVRRVIGHTHPRATGPSDGDWEVLGILRQRLSWIFEIGGDVNGTAIRPR